MSAHSPGPWKWWKRDNRSIEGTMPVLEDANGNDVCRFGDDTQYYPTEGTPPNEADAALIAAAPTLKSERDKAVELVRILEHALSEMINSDYATTANPRPEEKNPDVVAAREFLASIDGGKDE